MEFKEGFNPGQSNEYSETNLGDGSQNFPGEVQHLTIINGVKNPVRVAKGLAQIHKEIGKDVPEPVKEQVRHYETKIPGTKDMEEKLTDGGFSKRDIKDALHLKELWSKEAFRTSDYPVIQEENLQLYSRIVREFKIYIMPLVEDEKPLREIMRQLHEVIVAPIMKIYQENGYSDENLRYTYDHIYGIIYYLTGNCHLNWKDYDDDNI